jgi:hypothetical protein
MDLCYLYKLKLFILYQNKNITKIRDLFKGGEKFIKQLLFLLTYFFFCFSERLFESQDDSLLCLFIFNECWQLNTLSGHLASNFIWVFLCSTYIIFVPSNICHSRKEVGNSFVVKFFHREGIIIEQGVI